jgi:hypothetical protein
MNLSSKQFVGAIILGCTAFGIAVSLHFQGNPANTEANAIKPTVPESATMPVALTQKPPVKTQTDSAVDWEREFNNSSDYFAFVSKAARKAYDGDGRAALYISKALYLCVPTMKEFAKSSDAQADFDAVWATRTKAPQSTVERARKDFQTCAGFLKADAFAGLPNRAGGYNSIRFWSGESTKDGDPIAQVEEAGADIAKTVLTKSSDENAKSLESAQLEINKAMASKDPAALFQVGRLLSDGHASSDLLQGFAISIAACNLGYDCTTANAELFQSCAARGTCAAGMTYADMIKQVVGDSGYAQAYARAQQIQEAIARGDTKTVEQFAQLKRNP